MKLKCSHLHHVSLAAVEPVFAEAQVDWLGHLQAATQETFCCRGAWQSSGLLVEGNDAVAAVQMDIWLLCLQCRTCTDAQNILGKTYLLNTHILIPAVTKGDKT